MVESLGAIAILGTGSMGSAILAGLRREDVAVDAIRVTTRSELSAETLRADGVDARALEHDADANLWAVQNADVVILGVKPVQIVALLDEIRDELSPHALVVSVAAGVTTEAMQAAVTNPVVRAMPNTPALIGRGVTGVSGGDRASTADLARAVALFRTVGQVVELAESHIDALSTISGSGPAYVFFLMEALTAAARSHGFDDDVARLMVQETFIGASLLLDSTGDDPEELRRRVTSPKGTTERAIGVLHNAGLDDVFVEATAAALARAKELAAS